MHYYVIIAEFQLTVNNDILLDEGFASFNVFSLECQAGFDLLLQNKLPIIFNETGILLTELQWIYGVTAHDRVNIQRLYINTET